jgi:hypothetical protein
MKTNKLYIVIGLIVAFAAFFELTANANELDQSTILTFSQPIEVPGQVLPAGTYLFTLTSSDADRTLVQIFNSDRTHLYGMFQTIPTERRSSTDDPVSTFAQQCSGNQKHHLKWFYRRRLNENDVFSVSRQEKELARDTQETVVAREQPTSNSEPAGMGN